jgi:hypothetical protein
MTELDALSAGHESTAQLSPNDSGSADDARSSQLDGATECDRQDRRGARNRAGREQSRQRVAENPAAPQASRLMEFKIGVVLVRGVLGALPGSCYGRK